MTKLRLLPVLSAIALLSLACAGEEAAAPAAPAVPAAPAAPAAPAVPAAPAEPAAPPAAPPAANRYGDGPCGKPEPIRFGAGASGGGVEGGVPRGEMNCYTFGAKAGQTLDIRVTSLEDNAVFQLYAPGWSDTAETGPSGTSLPGTAPGADAKRFSGPLPASGEYLLVVGSTRGGTEFKVAMSIR